MSRKVEKQFQYIVYNNGLEWKTFDNEQDAKDTVRLYDGNNDVWYEKEHLI